MGSGDKGTPRWFRNFLPLSGELFARCLEDAGRLIPFAPTGQLDRRSSGRVQKGCNLIAERMQKERNQDADRVQKHRRKAGVSVIQSHCISVKSGAFTDEQNTPRSTPALRPSFPQTLPAHLNTLLRCF